MQKSLTSYDILNVSQHASQADIHAAYRRLAKTWHPDLHRANEETRIRANKNFQLLQQAYNDIKTPTARSNYNQKLARMKRAVIAGQNKVMNDNSPLRNFFKALDTIFNPAERTKG